MTRQSIHTAIDHHTYRLLTDWDYSYDFIENSPQSLDQIVIDICTACGYDYDSMVSYMQVIDPYNCLGIISDQMFN